MSERNPPDVPDIGDTIPELPRIEIHPDTLNEPVDRAILKEIERDRRQDGSDDSDE